MGARKRCAFCGATDQKMSKEHVWPKWLVKYAPSSIRVAEHSYTYTDGAGLERKVERRQIFSMVVREVCEPCNHGWMNEIEEAARPYLNSILAGRRRVMRHEGQMRLAAWGYLKMQAAQLAFRSQQWEQLRSDRQAFFALREQPAVPGEIAVYAAAVDWPAGKPGHFRLNGVGRNDDEGNLLDESGERIDGYVGVFSGRSFVALALRLDGESQPDFVKLGHGPGITRAIGRIWPIRETFTWPPGPQLTWSGLQLLAGGAET